MSGRFLRTARSGAPDMRAVLHFLGSGSGKRRDGLTPPPSTLAESTISECDAWTLACGRSSLYKSSKMLARALRATCLTLQALQPLGQLAQHGRSLLAGAAGCGILLQRAHHVLHLVHHILAVARRAPQRLKGHLATAESGECASSFVKRACLSRNSQASCKVAGPQYLYQRCFYAGGCVGHTAR